MDIGLRYGRGELAVTLPEGLDVTIIRKPAMPVVPEAEAAVYTALLQPVGAARPLIEAARGKGSACILVCDITRPVPNGMLLPPIIAALREAGVPRQGITILVATGLHRPNEGAELAEVIGDDDVMREVNVANHYARNDADHVDLGRTRSGTVVKLDRRFIEAEVRIATGLVEPHFMAGYSGGRKVIAPGIAHAETITTFHSARFMEHPKCANCVLEGNPLHEEQIEIMGMIGGALAVNTVIDEQRRLAFVNYGEVITSHLEAVSFVRRFAEVPVARRFSTILTSSAGHPLDKTYYQTVKGMVGPIDILAPGGDIIVASACSEGMGSSHYVEAQRRLLAEGAGRFLDGLKAKTHAAIDEWQTEMQLKPMRVGQLHLYTDGLKGEARGLTGVAMIESIEQAISASVARHNSRAVAVIPEGPYVVPVFRPGVMAA